MFNVLPSWTKMFTFGLKAYYRLFLELGTHIYIHNGQEMTDMS